MGKSKDKKNKGHGKEKTLAKTEKKIQKNIKKELEEIGEDDIEKIIANINEEEKLLKKVEEKTLPSGEFPSPRGGATFSILPEKEELILFGGEFYDGHKVYVYNDLYIYNIKKNEWTSIKAPNAPKPRTFHQSVAVSRNGGELWVFGGEFSSPSQSQFYHYNDLYVFNFQDKKWNKIESPNAPSPRSGHRMVLLKKYLTIFGGYYDNLRNCKFYNDTHLFNLETNQWEEIKFSANGLIDIPSPRSACHLINTSKNNVIIFGGFSKEKLKKDKEKGLVHSDMFVLSYETKKNGSTEWSWKRVKQSGLKPSDRISSSMIAINNDIALLFGGVYDNEDLDDMNDENTTEKSCFYNDLYKLDLNTNKWSLVNLKGKKKLKSNKIEKDGNDSNSSESDIDATEELEALSIKPEKNDIKEPAVFEVSYSKNEQNQLLDNDEMMNKPDIEVNDIFRPSVRRSSYIQFHKSKIYLYGGKFEDGEDNEIVFNDMYCLNVKKMDEWKTIHEDKLIKVENSNSSDEENDEESDMEIDAPEVKLNESFEDYFDRTADFWIEEASKEFLNEKSNRVLKKMAHELCAMFWKNLSV